ncbi:MAG: ABC transporter substrate-binding protein [Candidatus Methanoperedenaceae archaeon]|nr:MAG: ABC transporter substrate-binding protein [Candidatus Methanoperedenaceae archaeon]
MTNKNLLVSVVIVLLILAVAGAYLSQNNNEEPVKKAQNSNDKLNVDNALKAEKPTIKANVNKDCAGTPWFVGQQKGFFEKAGINFVDQGHLDWAQQPSALISGQTNVADAHPNSIINLLKEGAKVKGVVAGGDEPPEGDIAHEHMHWLVLENSSLQEAKDILKTGKKIKIAVGAFGICADLETNDWLRQNGIPGDKVELVIIPDPQQEQALRQGLIDVAVLHPPFYTAAEEHGGVRILVSSRKVFGDAAGITLLYFTEDFIKNNPDAVRKFIRGYKNSERWSNDNPVESAAITAKEIGLEKSTVHFYNDTGEIDKNKIQKWIDAMVKDGIIKQGEYTPDDLYTDQFKDEWILK